MRGQIDIMQPEHNWHIMGADGKGSGSPVVSTLNLPQLPASFMLSAIRRPSVIQQPKIMKQIGTTTTGSIIVEMTTQEYDALQQFQRGGLTSKLKSTADQEVAPPE